MTLDSRNTPTDDAGLDDVSLLAIRSLVAGQPATDPMQREEPLRGTVTSDAPQQRQRKANSLPPLAEPQAEDGRAPGKAAARRRSSRGGAAGGALAVVRARLGGYRPKPAHVTLAALLLFVVFRPWLMLGLVFVSLVIMSGVFLITGYDGFWHGVMKISRWYARRNPGRASAIHHRLDAFAMRWDAVLDRFPEGTVDGLYLPDFGGLATADARHDEAMERRLAALRQKEA